MESQYEFSDAEFEVERILRHRVHAGETEYLLQWKYHPDSDCSWEPEENLENCQQLIREYHQQRQEKINKFLSDLPNYLKVMLLIPNIGGYY